MPWDGTKLWTASLTGEGGLGPPVFVAGGLDESVVQPEWSPTGELFFFSDRTGWANIYRCHDGHIEPVKEMEAEFARANWWVGMCSFGFDSPGSLICSYAQRGSWILARISIDGKRLEPTVIPYTEMG